MMESINTETTDQEGTCLNCDSVVQEDFLYCAKCSQRLRTSKISVGALMTDFVSSMFNFDSRFFQSFLKMLKPGELSRLYMIGKRKRYLNPARLFLFSMLFHFGVLAYITKGAEVEINTDILSSKISKSLTKATLLTRYDSLVAVIPIDTTAEMDSLRSHLFKDIIDAPVDSISFGRNTTVTGSDDLFQKKYHFDDVINMPEEEFLTHYKIEGFWKSTIAKQSLRLYRDPSAVYTFFIGNLIWGVVLSLLFLSFVMKSLYWSGKRFYVEHLILLMHIHSFIFILVGLALLLDILTNNAIGVWLWVTAGIAAIYFFISIYRYYGQGLFKTFIKFLVILFAYVFIISIFALFILMISLLVF